MIDIKKIADEADMILNGYAYTRKQNIIQVLNLNDLKSASVLSLDGDVLETTMDDIELSIILDHYKRDRKYMKEIVQNIKMKSATICYAECCDIYSIKDLI